MSLINANQKISMFSIGPHSSPGVMLISIIISIIINIKIYIYIYICNTCIYIYIERETYIMMSVIITNGLHSDPGVMLISDPHSNEHH